MIRARIQESNNQFHSPGHGFLDNMKHDTPQIVILSAIAAPLSKREACKDNVFIAGKLTTPHVF